MNSNISKGVILYLPTECAYGWEHDTLVDQPDFDTLYAKWISSYVFYWMNFLIGVY